MAKLEGTRVLGWRGIEKSVKMVEKKIQSSVSAKPPDIRPGRGIQHPCNAAHSRLHSSVRTRPVCWSVFQLVCSEVWVCSWTIMIWTDCCATRPDSSTGPGGPDQPLTQSRCKHYICVIRWSLPRECVLASNDSIGQLHKQMLQGCLLQLCLVCYSLGISCDSNLWLRIERFHPIRIGCYSCSE